MGPPFIPTGGVVLTTALGPPLGEAGGKIVPRLLDVKSTPGSPSVCRTFRARGPGVMKLTGVGTGERPGPGSFGVCPPRPAHLCGETHPPSSNADILAVETELGLFRRTTLLPLNRPLSGTG